MLSQGPSWPYIRKKAHLQRLAAIAGTEHGYEPVVSILPGHVHGLCDGLCRFSVPLLLKTHFRQVGLVVNVYKVSL